MKPITPKQQGFTLIELIVGLVILVVLAVMAYSALDEAMLIQKTNEDTADRTAKIVRAVTLLQQDFEQTMPRSIRDEFGDKKPAMQTISDDAFQLIELTRGGWKNPLNQARSDLMRVGYGIKEDTLIRYQWLVLDRAQDSEPRRLELLEGVSEIEFRFLNSQDKWQKTWPQDDTDPDNSESKPESTELPKAIEVTLQLKDWGTITRLFHGQF